ncbi:MAG: hypothetical protein IKQ92_09825 [Clostridia bacterium]|nr:hypothetical protein [Clostridia bacterium]
MVRRIALMTALILAVCLLFAACAKNDVVLNYQKLVQDCEKAGVKSMEEMKTVLNELYAGKMVSVEGWAKHSRAWLYKIEDNLCLESSGDEWFGSLSVTGRLTEGSPEYVSWNSIYDLTHCVAEGKVRRITVDYPDFYQDRMEEWKFNPKDVKITLLFEAVSAVSQIYEDAGAAK